MNRARFFALLLATSLSAACRSAPDEPVSRVDPTPSAAPSPPPAATTAAAPAPASAASDDIPAPPDVARAPSDASCTPSRLCSKVITKGTGKDHPKATSKVKVHYTGWMKNGKMFDSSVKRGEPASFGLDQVIPGWTEGVQLMVEGETRRFWIPSALAYGDTPSRPGAPSGDLVFDVQLLEIEKAPEPPTTPTDLAKPPASAKKTKSGLAYRVLKKGTGKDHPTATSSVTVHYSGWTKDGKMFDSSVVRGEPATFGLNQVIPGWTEGVQLMVVGDKTRFWIPADLAYGKVPSRPGAPAGDLVFDIELIAIH